MDERLKEQIAAAAIEEGLADIVYSRTDSAIGELLVARSAKGLCRIAFAEEDEDEVLGSLAAMVGPRVIRSAAATAELTEALVAYLAGETAVLDLPVDLSLVASPFQKKVLTTLARRVGRGQVTTYGELARRTGHPRAARAAGTACARNPVPLVVPCHRVIQTSGAIGAYGGQVWRKRYLLELEGALPAGNP